MSAPRRVWVTALPVLSLALVWLPLPGCHKQPRVEFPRPPASASVPEEPPPPPVAPEAETPPPEPEPAPEEPAPTANHRARPPRRSTPPPPSEPEPPPQPPPAPSPRLTPSKDDDPSAIQDKIRRSEALLSSVRERTLSPQQREQAETATGFVAQAKDAVAEGEWRRAAVLADKAFILAEDVERASRD